MTPPPPPPPPPLPHNARTVLIYIYVHYIIHIHTPPLSYTHVATATAAATTGHPFSSTVSSKSIIFPIYPTARQPTWIPTPGPLHHGLPLILGHRHSSRLFLASPPPPPPIPRTSLYCLSTFSSAYLYVYICQWSLSSSFPLISPLISLRPIPLSLFFSLRALLYVWYIYYVCEPCERRKKGQPYTSAEAKGIF